MRPITARRRRGIVALATTLALIALASASALAESRSAHRRDVPRSPLRAVFYPAAKARATANTAGRPGPSTPQGGPAAIRRDLEALKWAWADAAIVPWTFPGSAADRRFGAVLSAIASTQAHVRAVALIDRPRGTEVAQLNALARSRTRSPGYLRIGSAPAVFVAPADHALRSCRRALRWRAAAGRLWLAQATFPGYSRCRRAADAWFRDTPDTRSARSRGTFLIRPGFWPVGPSAPTLARSPATWLRTVARMNASAAPLQIVDSLTDWARGTAIGPSAAWPSASGFGSYLDALHAQAPGGAPVSAPLAVEAVSISGVSAHQASVTATVTGAGPGSALWVEFGPTIAYGKKTAPLSLTGASARQTVTVTLPVLSAGTAYHARISVTSPAGPAMSADSVFTTLADPRGVRLAAAGDIACSPISDDFNGGAGTATSVTSWASRTRSSRASTTRCSPLGDLQYESGTAAQFAASYDPSWGRLNAIAHPAVGNHEYGSSGRRALLPVFRRGGRSTRSGVLLLRARLLAHDRAQLELRADRRLRHRFASGRLAAGRSRRHIRPAARWPTGTTRGSRRVRPATPGRWSRSGRISTTPARSSCSAVTTTSTSASRPRTRRARSTRFVECASSSSGPAARIT